MFSYNSISKPQPLCVALAESGCVVLVTGGGEGGGDLGGGFGEGDCGGGAVGGGGDGGGGLGGGLGEGSTGGGGGLGGAGMSWSRISSDAL